MASSSTFTSMSARKSNPKDLCIICEIQPYDLICTCGDKFDFNCIHQHVEQLGVEFQDFQALVSDQMVQLNGLLQNNDFNAARALINNWKRKRIQDINDIADIALNQVQERQDSFAYITPLKDDFELISKETQRVVHENLNAIIELHRKIQNKFEEFVKLPDLLQDDISLDSSVQSKLNPQLLNTNSTSTNDHLPSSKNDHFTSSGDNHVTTSSANDYVSSSAKNHFSSSSANDHISSLLNKHVSSSSSSINKPDLTPAEFEPTKPITSDTNVLTNEEPITTLTNTDNGNDSIDRGTNNDDFEAGHTRHIQRNSPILISTNNDKFAGTICCHGNQLIYNDYDRTTQRSRLTFLPDLTRPTTKQIIEWNTLDETVDGGNDDDSIQDIVYSDILSAYLLLTRTRLRLFQEDGTELEDFHRFEDRHMKRLSCSRRYIYLTSTQGSVTHNGDEIILMNYDKEEQICKTFKDIIPSRINRGSGPLLGDISDIAVGANEQVTIGYRLERRHEVGVCVFNVTGDGREWSCIKQLLLNECWHDDLSYTPRAEWCDTLNVFILIEHMTGHLIMIDRDGQVAGECRFMHAINQRQSPINLTISANDWICIRYESSISIHKIIGSPRS